MNATKNRKNKKLTGDRRVAALARIARLRSALCGIRDTQYATADEQKDCIWHEIRGLSVAVYGRHLRADESGE